jgi:pyruvate formate-lyase activating enzyme-like uncharacterized protein
MIIDVNEATLASIQNPALRSYAEQYVRIYQNFIQQIRQMGMEVEETDDYQQIRERIAALGSRGATVRNEGKSVYVNRISPGCQACQTGVGSLTFFVSLRCHRNCFFCFNPNQERYEYHREHTRDTVAELDALHASGQRFQHLALTGGEPLLHKEETVRFFQRARRNFPKAYTRLYTSGDHLERETLQALKDAGMSEIRISIRLEDTEIARRHTFDQITLAREYIPNVMVEMPVLPGALNEMKAILTELDLLGAFGINLLEFCFPFHNADEYRIRGYRIRARPFRVLYNYAYAGGSPVAGSEATCLDLIEFTLEAGLKLGVHYCSLENKQTGQVYLQNTQRGSPKVLYFSQRDYFLKSAKVFGEDVEGARQIFDRNGYHDYRLSNEYQSLEFHVSKIKMLKRLNVQVGVSTNIMEKRNGKTYLRELKVDLTTPQDFRLSDV